MDDTDCSSGWMDGWPVGADYEPFHVLQTDNRIWQ